MDRELDVSERRRRTGRRVALGVSTLTLVATVLLLLPGWLRPSVRRAEIRTARVERGPVEGAVEASGTVIPAFESVLSSPVEARVQRVLKRPGEMVREGEEILRLDTSAYRLVLERLEDQLAKKINEQQQLRLSLDKSLAGLRSRIETSRLDAEALEHRAEQSRKLRAAGLVSEESLRAAEVEAKKAAIELEQLRGSVEGERRSTQAQLAGLDLDLATLRKELAEARRQLELATTRSDRAGVLTWVLPQEGATVQRGEVIARIADLDSFRVEATVSDIHSARLAAGLPARVIVDREVLNGRLASVHPTIENGAVRFFVDLDDADHPKLRNNLSVDVLAVTAARRDALRLRKIGSGGREEGARPVFVVDPADRGRAVRRDVRFGLSGAEYDEVLDGLKEGEEVILSDMSDYLHLDQVNLR